MQTHNNLYTHGKHSHCPCSAMRFLKKYNEMKGSLTKETHTVCNVLNFIETGQQFRRRY